MSSSRDFPRQSYIPIALVLIAAIGAYIRTLGFDFVYDDKVQVVANHWIRDAGNLPQIFSTHVWGFLSEKPTANIYRPMMHVIYMGEYQLFGLTPGGFHFGNLLFHALNSVLVFFVALRLMLESGTCGAGSRARLIALGSGLLFALHPVNTEVVTWIAAVPELSYTFFILISFYLYLTSKNSAVKYIISLAAFLLALMSKEPAMALLLFIPAFEFLPGSVKREGFWKRYLPYIGVAIFYMAIRSIILGGIIYEKNPELTFYESVLNIFPLLSGYIWKLIYPANLNVLYEFHPVSSIIDGPVIFALLTISALAVSLYLVRRRALILFLIVWIFVPILPVLYVPALTGAAFAERYLYLPSAAYAILLSYSFVTIYNFRESSIFRNAMIVAALVLIAVFAFSTVKRTSVWRDEVTLWTDGVKKSPLLSNVHYNLAWAYEQEGNRAGAAKEYNEAIRLDTGKKFPDAHYNLGNIYYREGRLGDALAQFRAARDIDPAFMDAALKVKDLEGRLSGK